MTQMMNKTLISSLNGTREGKFQEMTWKSYFKIIEQSKMCIFTEGEKSKGFKQELRKKQGWSRWSLSQEMIRPNFKAEPSTMRNS